VGAFVELVMGIIMAQDEKERMVRKQKAIIILNIAFPFY